MRDSGAGDTGAEDAPLLQHLDGSMLQRKCSVSKQTSLSKSGALDESVHDTARCFLQHGGETASGKRVTKKLVLACVLAFGFMVFEVIGGSLAHSVAILSDAAHMFSDVFSFIVSIYCMQLIRKKATSSYSYGYHRAETMGALISVLIVCVITGGLVLEAIQRLIHPTDIDGKLMFIVATTGIGFNILLLLTLGHDHHHHLGGSCGHDHGHGHGHAHAGAHAHGTGHANDSACGHDHGHAHSHACDSSHADEHACGGHVHHTASKNGCSGHHHCGHDHDHGHDHGHGHGHDHHHDHDHSEDQSARPGMVEALSVERSSSQNGLLHVKLGASDPSGYLDNGGPQCRSHAHGASGHMQCQSHGHAHGHSHCDGGHHHDHDNQNLRGAIVHVLGDILQSVGVAIAGAIIWYTDADPKWLWVDPACTFLFAISVVWVTKTLIYDIVNDLMEATPADINVDELMEQMGAVAGVRGLHDLHVWRVGTGKVMLTAHIDVVDKSDPYSIIECIESVISAAGIVHSTVQICSGTLETKH